MAVPFPWFLNLSPEGGAGLRLNVLGIPVVRTVNEKYLPIVAVALVGLVMARSTDQVNDTEALDPAASRAVTNTG